MTKYRIENITCYLAMFLDDEIEADDEIDAKDMIMNEVIDNIGNYIDIELEEIYEEDDKDDEDK